MSKPWELILNGDPRTLGINHTHTHTHARLTCSCSFLLLHQLCQSNVSERTKKTKQRTSEQESRIRVRSLLFRKRLISTRHGDREYWSLPLWVSMLAHGGKKLTNYSKHTEATSQLHTSPTRRWSARRTDIRIHKAGLQANSQIPLKRHIDAFANVPWCSHPCKLWKGKPK